MTKRRTNKDTKEEPMPATASKPKKPNRTGIQLSVYLEPSLRHAIDQLADKTRRSLTEEVSIALENHLVAAGLWPPSSTDD